jgi:serine/threonine protein kinase
MSDRLDITDCRGPGEVASTDWPSIPGYEVLGELGRGGMGVVYRARQLSLNRLVALKLIRDSALASPERLARFRIEMEAAARMRHPNVVSIHEIGEHQGRPYFAMEFVEGASLEAHLGGRPQPVLQAADLLRTLARAVEHAHSQNIVHRDLKPSNILLDASGAPKITDFGLAKRLDSQSTALTEEGAVVGTASYMAPEQAGGRVREIGPATDLYALGALLYEMLTGRPPFLADSWQHVIEQVLHDEPPPLSRLRPDVPADLETICLKCLEKEPARRYASAAELADDLGRFLEGKAVTAVPLSPAERLARLAARDGYELVGEIGRGPRSTVYRARHGAISQPVALKVFTPPGCTREEWEARLRAGTDSWAGLAHPHIVTIQRTGWWDGAPYVAMDLAPHGSLAGRLASQRFPIPDALKLVEQLAEVVSYLHRQGVVHGNLKPSNVLFAGDGIPRVSDFRPTGGLFQGELSIEDSDPASLAHVAPEVLSKPDAEPRPHTDIYGLGLILYELLTGRSPFAAATARDTMEQVCSQEPVPSSRINSQVTSELDACCLHCLKKDPWQRYNRAYNLMMRLRYFQENPERGSAGFGR